MSVCCSLVKFKNLTHPWIVSFVSGWMAAFNRSLFQFFFGGPCGISYFYMVREVSIITGCTGTFDTLQKEFQMAKPLVVWRYCSSNGNVVLLNRMIVLGKIHWKCSPMRIQAVIFLLRRCFERLSSQCSLFHVRSPWSDIYWACIWVAVYTVRLYGAACWSMHFSCFSHRDETLFLISQKTLLFGRCKKFLARFNDRLEEVIKEMTLISELALWVRRQRHQGATFATGMSGFVDHKESRHTSSSPTVGFNATEKTTDDHDHHHGKSTCFQSSSFNCEKKDYEKYLEDWDEPQDSESQVRGHKKFLLLFCCPCGIVSYH